MARTAPAPPFHVSSLISAVVVASSRPAAACRPATARPTNRRRLQPRRRLESSSPFAGRAKKYDDDRDGNDEPSGSFVAPPGAGRKLSVDGPLPSTAWSLGTEKSSVRVAYQGSPGTVTEVMVLKAFPGSTPIPFKRFETAFKAVESSAADVVVLPIENSSTGSFHQSYDFLLRHNLQIVQEMQMDVELCLLALPGVRKEDLQIIFSHPQDLVQCEHSLSNLGVSKKIMDDGADGAKIISKQKLRDAGVICSAQAAELYGLNILEYNFQDASPNITRYLALSTIANLPKGDGQFKTSIVFGLEEGPEILYKALGALWKREIKLTKIESKPNKGRPMRTLGAEKRFNYIFYVDFEASMAEVRAQSALKDLKEIASFLRVLGCYPWGRTV